MKTTDFLVIGGGVIGLSIARCLKAEFSDPRVTLIEKESACGLHASGRNSGVLHAGFYYSPDSLKARFTKAGNRMMTQYCASRSIPVNTCGKIVVAKDEGDLAHLDELIRRGRVNGIELYEITEREAKEIEPRAKTFGRAVFSPTTATVDPNRVMEALKEDAVAEGVRVEPGVCFVRKKGREIITTAGVYSPAYVVNAAGLYADKIAREFGFSERYRILPFKGLYLYSEEPPGALRTNVYPVPDLRNPFLGVHFTVTAGGAIKIGPTAIPAFWREHYQSFDNFSLRELLDIVSREISLFLHANFDFTRLAYDELRKQSRAHMVSLASALVSGIKREHYQRWGKPGIRAQLLDIRQKRLEMDFVTEGDDRSYHVLNAVSPAFTCAIPFATHVCREIRSRISSKGE